MTETTDAKKILLVEDNPDDELLTIRALKKHNIFATVVVARDGADALEILFKNSSDTGREQHVLPDLVLLDLKLPKLDGFEVLRRIRSNERTMLLPIVVLTTSGEPSDIRECYRLGANAYIRKPVDFERFAEMIKQLGFFWLVLNEPPSM